MTTLIAIVSFFTSGIGFLIKNWDIIATILASIGSLLGISCLQVFNRNKKIEEDKTTVQAIATAPKENAIAIKEVKIRKQKQGKYEFIINNLLLVLGLFALNWFIIFVLKMPLFEKDVDFAKNVISGLFFIDFVVLLMIAGRIVSSITTFDNFVQGLPIIKSFFKK